MTGSTNTMDVKSDGMSTAAITLLQNRHVSYNLCDRVLTG